MTSDFLIWLPVKLFTNYAGEKQKGRKYWHLSTYQAGTKRTLCGSEAFGVGDSRAEFETKAFLCKGSITCPECKRIVTAFKNITI